MQKLLIMDFKTMVESAVKNGADEKKMWQSVYLAEDVMEYLQETAPGKYDCFLRKFNEIFNGKHYNEEFATEDVGRLRYTDKEGNEHTGAHWTMDEVETATAGMTFPNGTTKFDRFVAFNAAYADFCKSFSDEDVLRIAYDFYFADEDWKGNGKIWEYMSMNV